MDTDENSRLDALEGITTKTGDVIAGICVDHLSRRTPCPDYDVRGLLDHHIGWTRSFAACVQGERSGGGDGDAYRAGPDPAAEYREAADRIVDGFRTRGTDRTVEMMSASLPAGMVLSMSLGEQLTHGWDLAVATGQPVPYTDQEAEAAGSIRAVLTSDHRGEGKNFGSEVDPPEDATEVERFIAFMGRDPRP